MGADQPVDDRELLGLLKRAAADQGAKAWVVGGYVRDHLLGRAQPDLDVVVEEGGGRPCSPHASRSWQGQDLRSSSSDMAPPR